MKKILINNREGLSMCQLPHSGTGIGLQVGRVVQMVPGANLVDSADLEELLKNRGFSIQFEALIPKSPAAEQNPEKVGKPILEMMQVDGKDLIVADERPLAALKPETAKALIREVLMPGVLVAWQKEEVRPEIVMAIRAQLTALEADPVIAAAGQ